MCRKIRCDEKSCKVLGFFGASKQGVCLIDRPCLVHPENQKVFKISRHIESCNTCMKH